MKVCIVTPICVEKTSEVNKEGNKDFRGVMMSNCCDATKSLIDSSMIIGVKNQRGIKINAIKIIQIEIEEKVFDFVNLKMRL